ncbi:MAG: hypothetical protein DBX55_09335 [Verrucomicrobia bacterium]|nr:MAG: hypothetical protein DBX55_09335 [Verrucomicrobiota bacterium]
MKWRQKNPIIRTRAPRGFQESKRLGKKRRRATAYSLGGKRRNADSRRPAPIPANPAKRTHKTR